MAKKTTKKAAEKPTERKKQDSKKIEKNYLGNGVARESKKGTPYIAVYLDMDKVNTLAEKSKKDNIRLAIHQLKEPHGKQTHSVSEAIGGDKYSQIEFMLNKEKLAGLEVKSKNDKNTAQIAIYPNQRDRGADFSVFQLQDAQDKEKGNKEIYQCGAGFDKAKDRAKAPKKESGQER